MNRFPVLPLVTSIAVLLSPLRAAEQGHGSGASAAGIAPASNEGELAIKSFKLDEGLKVQLWAAEPLLANPVAFTQDEKGRWYVAESFRQERGIEDNRKYKQWQDDDIASHSTADRLAYMHKHFPDATKFKEQFEKYEDRIRRLEDTTGSGVADKATVFADGFRDALDGTGAGLIARGNQVWWTCIPNLWRFTDKNDDGVAEEKNKLLTGFGIKFALRGHDMHGLRFGPDGKLYFSIGDRAINVTSKEGKNFAETEAGTIMRCNPDGTGFEVFATGVRNPQELAFDEHGNLFTGDNNSDAGDKARFTYLVEGGDCGWRMAFQYLPDRGPWMRERPWDEKVGPTQRHLIPCIANIGNGPSGLTYNPGTGLSERYRGKFFLSDFRGGANASTIHEISVKPKGAFFTATARDFMKGVLSTDVEFGNDGSLYVLDWVASWGGVGKGRIYKVSASDEAPRAEQNAVKKLISEGVGQIPGEVVQLLGSKDMRVRQAAQFKLVELGVASAKLLSAYATEQKETLGRLHAIWGLGQLAEKDASVLAPLPKLLADPDAEVRAQAARVLGDHRVKGAAEKLVALLGDKENRVRYSAALSLGKIGHAPAVEALCTMLAQNNDEDPILRHGGVMGLAGCAKPEQLVAIAKGGAPVPVRGAIAVALRRLQSPLVGELVKDADESVVLDAARAIHDAPIVAAFPALASLTTNEKLTSAPILSRAINARYRLGGAENARALADLATRGNAPEAARKDALDALTIWANPNPKDRLLNQWRPLPPRGAGDALAAVGGKFDALLKGTPDAIREAAAKLAGALGVKDAGAALFALAADTRAGTAARVEAIKSLASLQDKHLADVARLAVSDKNAKVRSEGLQALAATDPGAAVSAIAKVIDSGSAAEKQGALAALAHIKSDKATALLGELLDRLAAGKLAPEIQVDVLDAVKALRSAPLLQKIAAYEASLPKNDELAKYRVALVGGDAERGRKIFREKAEVQCLRCHKCEIGDSVVGPELTRIGATRDRAYLLEAIVYPNKAIAPGFDTVVVTLKDGNIVAGRLASEDAAALKVEALDATGKPATTVVPKGNIKDRMSAPSPMPPGMGELLSRSELRDVVEYMATRK